MCNGQNFLSTCIFTNCSIVGADCTVAAAEVNKAAFTVEHMSRIPMGEKPSQSSSPWWDQDNRPGRTSNCSLGDPQSETDATRYLCSVHGRDFYSGINLI